MTLFFTSSEKVNVKFSLHYKPASPTTACQLKLRNYGNYLPKPFDDYVLFIH